MKKQKSLVVNYIMNTILTMSSIVFPIITFPYVSRILLPEGTGKVSFATSVIMYFSMFAQLGIPTYGVRACAKVRDDKTELSKVVHELLIINMLMCIIAYLGFGIALFCVPRLREEKTLFVIMSLSIIFNTIGVEWLYKALEQYTYITVRSLFFKGIALIAMFLLVREKSDYIIYGAISIFAASASNVFNFINLRKHIFLKKIGSYQLQRHLKAIVVFFAMSCAATVYTNLDTAMLGFMKTDDDVGYYNAAVKVKNILVSVVTSLGTVLLPRVSYYVENGFKDEFLKISKKALNFVILTSIPVFVYFTLYARESIFFLSGEAYSNSVIPMQIIMPTLLFIGMTNIIGIQILLPLGKEKYVLYSEIAGAIVDLILNILLIPKFAAAGAAIGTLVAEFTVWIVQCWYMREKIRDLYYGIRYALICFAVIASSVCALGIKCLDLGVFVSLIISAVIYFGVYLLIMLICKEKLVLEIEKKLLGVLKK